MNYFFPSQQQLPQIAPVGKDKCVPGMNASKYETKYPISNCSSNNSNCAIDDYTVPPEVGIEMLIKFYFGINSDNTIIKFLRSFNFCRMTAAQTVPHHVVFGTYGRHRKKATKSRK